MRLARKLTEERGVALPVALAVLFTVAGLATVAARAAIVSNNQSFRDKNAKRAVQGAGAGIQAAIYQLNLMQPGSTQCVRKDSTTGALTNGALQADNWCQAQTEDLGDGATYAFQVSAPTSTTSSTGLGLETRKIVSYGTVTGVRRRATVTLQAHTGAPMFPPGYAVVVRDSVDMKNNATINGHIGSNGTITFKNNATICGNVLSGPGSVSPPKFGTNPTRCPGDQTGRAAEPYSLQPVDLSPVKPTGSDNDRLTNMKASPPVSPQDTCAGCNKIAWNPSTKVLTVDSGGTLTLSGDRYLFCRLEVKSSGVIQIPYRTSPLRIFIDTPEACGGTSGMGSVIWDGQLVNLYSPPHAMLIAVAGSSSKSTLVDLPTNDATSPIGIYAPNSTVNMKNNVQFTGAVIAKSLTLMNNAHFTWHDSINGITSGSGIRFFQLATGSYKECTGTATTTVPDSGC
jgi:Tfp pilus assembly protein PilX